MRRIIRYTGSAVDEGGAVQASAFSGREPSALSITVNRMIMRLFDGVGCARPSLLSRRSPPEATILELFGARSIHTLPTRRLSRSPPRCTCADSCTHEHAHPKSCYLRTIMRASGASGVSNEMQEVRARVIHLQRLRERGQRWKSGTP